MIGLTSSIKYEPKGQVLIIGPWNYPFMLAINPLIYAIAAGNAVIVKPSEISANTSSLVKEMIAEIFPTNEVTVIEGGVEETTHLLAKKFNHIYFTGSPNVGKVVMEASAKHLCSVTLELGGKSPQIVFDDADLDGAVEGVVDAIWFNQGQVCCAGSRLLMQESIADTFIDKLKARMQTLRVGDPLDKSMDIGAIVAPVIFPSPCCAAKVSASMMRVHRWYGFGAVSSPMSVTTGNAPPAVLGPFDAENSVDTIWPDGHFRMTLAVARMAASVATCSTLVVEPFGEPRVAAPPYTWHDVVSQVVAYRVDEPS